MATVSIILPTFNRLGYLRFALASVYDQTYTDWEMIIADDGSNEEMLSYLDSISNSQVQILRLAHSGNPGHVRNAAIAAASGYYLAFLDSDDIWAPRKLERQVTALGAHPECRWSYTACERIDPTGRRLENEHLRNLPLMQGWIFEPLLKLETSVAMPALVAEKSLVHEVGGFDEAQKFGESHDLALRLSLRAQAWPLPEVLCSIRAHCEHFSADRIAAHVSWMRLYEKMRQLAPSPSLQRYCARMRAQTSLRAAYAQLNAQQRTAAWVTLVRALPFSWQYPGWWIGALKCLGRMFFPYQLVARLRGTNQ
jgi:glycosyltransferase involved in cell wall biosynthesis